MNAQPQVAPESLVSWPQEVSHEPTFKIGEVLDSLASEFPYLAASKLRYFESQELLAPHRTPSNQRMYSAADVERLRFILIEQRDRYTSLPQIKEMLKQLDTGLVQQAHPGRMRVLADNEVVKPQPGTRLHKDELAQLTGASIAEIEALIDAALLTPDSRGRLTTHAVDIVRYVRMLGEKGLDLRKIRMIRNSARQHAVNAVATLESDRSKSTPVFRERVVAEAGELATLMSNAYRALLLEGIDVELR
ncbi:DNA-binding transcriptional MerR regulator [Arcanobacterium wilhelmae]|uniref:DNA-binding transcriptional MerR regulator n=1 Tax=Arcanobacterium wilhelmae TaxID=1803177 RepID=A0ABT9N8H8_9ACTO|nr:MerR family transcriptional regulator [Arcanobacterium wilhelmae]MDP9800012.1 DNA-binding transcriptional MerR regulator [Arcanobacterium wilhelmae]WFN89510.1 MerR family transcriptional regulator [Arcanobacterium wilhelmae]